MPDLDKIKAIAQAFLDDAIVYDDDCHYLWSGMRCRHCNEYFEPHENAIQERKRDHSPDCLVLQAQELLREENV